MGRCPPPKAVVRAFVEQQGVPYIGLPLYDVDESHVTVRVIGPTARA